MLSKVLLSDFRFSCVFLALRLDSIRKVFLQLTRSSPGPWGCSPVQLELLCLRPAIKLLSYLSPIGSLCGSKGAEGQGLATNITLFHCILLQMSRN